MLSLALAVLLQGPQAPTPAIDPVARQPERLDLGAVPPDVPHSRLLTADRSYAFQLINRAPGARYRLTHLAPDPALRKMFILEPDPTNDLALAEWTGAPSCGDVAALVATVLRAADESTTAAGMKAAEASLPTSLCSMAGVILDTLRVSTSLPLGGVRLASRETSEVVLERLGPGSLTAVRTWHFRFSTGDPDDPGWEYPNEVAWLAHEAVHELVLWSRPGTDDDASIQLLPRHGVAQAFQVELRIGTAGQLRSWPLTFDTTMAWDPSAYQGLARGVLGGLATAKAKGPASEAVAALTDPRAVVIEEQNERISERLNRDPADAWAHEDAALLLVALGLRDSAEELTDIRLILARAAAHLAAAVALRGSADPGPAGALAEVGRLTLLGREREALVTLQAFVPRSPPEEAWVNAMRLRNTADWRILKRPVTSTLLERLEHFRALKGSMGGPQALKFFLSRNEETLPDWGRISLTTGLRPVSIQPSRYSRFSVEEGNTFAGTLPLLEMSDIATVLGRACGHELQPAAVIEALTAPSHACGPETRPARPKRVIDLATWADGFQRHVTIAILHLDDHLRLNLGLPKEANEATSAYRSRLSGITPFPLLSAYLLDSTEKEGVSLLGTRDEVCAAAGAFVGRRPQRVTPAVWRALKRRCPRLAHGFGDPLSRPDLWFGQSIPQGTTFDAPDRLGLLAKWGEIASVDALRAEAPHHKQILTRYYNLRFGRTAPTQAELEWVLGDLVDYDIGAMRARASLLAQDIEQYRAAMTRIAEVDPDCWLELGRYFAGRGRDADAAAAFDRALDEALDRVDVSNHVEWLVDYYLDHGDQERAFRAAREGADVGSGSGIEAMAHLMERRGQWSEAERFYRQESERYERDSALESFYIRYDRKANDASHKEDAKKAWAKIFPKGLRPQSVVPRSQPPSVGVRVLRSAPFLEEHDVAKGDVIVAIDGTVVESYEQFGVLRSLGEGTDASALVWHVDHYVETSAPLRRWNPAVDFATYPPGSRP